MRPVHKREHGIVRKIKGFVFIWILTVVCYDFRVENIVEKIIRKGIIGEKKDNANSNYNFPKKFLFYHALPNEPQRKRIENKHKSYDQKKQ